LGGGLGWGGGRRNTGRVFWAARGCMVARGGDARACAAGILYTYDVYLQRRRRRSPKRRRHAKRDRNLGNRKDHEPVVPPYEPDQNAYRRN